LQEESVVAVTELNYRLVDAFTQQRFQGNAAAVVLDAAGLSPEQMQRIALEMNQSETAFVLPVDPTGEFDLEIRWFTPAHEERMCGHATIATIHALAEAGRLPAALPPVSEPVRIKTCGGTLTAMIDEENVVWLELVDPVLTPMPAIPSPLMECLGLRAESIDDRLKPAKSQDGDLIFFVNNVITLNGLRPAFRELGDFCRQQRIRGVCVATTATVTPSVHVQSRFFAPAAGIDEDPLTRSVHGPLAAPLVASGWVPMVEDLAALRCVQSSGTGRAGLVRAFVQRQGESKWAARIGGSCVTSCIGVLKP
jgi:trans-2,3-dihydro-3-hydroxyanthranilate isomerase